MCLHVVNCVIAFIAGVVPDLTAVENRVSSMIARPPCRQLISYRELEIRKSFQKILHLRHLKKTRLSLQTNTTSCCYYYIVISII